MNTSLSWIKAYVPVAAVLDDDDLAAVLLDIRKRLGQNLRPFPIGKQILHDIFLRCDSRR